MNVGDGEEVSRVSYLGMWSELTYIHSDHSGDAVVVYGDASETTCPCSSVAPPLQFGNWDD